MIATDDVLVRELTDRVDRATPPMALDPAAVLAGGRRFRRRRAVVRSAAGVAGAAAVALGGVQLAGGLGDDAVEVAQLVTVGDFQVVAATEVRPLDVAGTTVYDTGVPADPADPDGARWVLEHVVVDPATLPPDVSPEEVVMDYVTARSYDPGTGTLGESGGAVFLDPQLAEDAASQSGMEVAGTLMAFGLPDPAYDPQVYVAGGSVDVPAELSRVMLPTFDVPGVGGPMFFVRVSGASPWPDVTVYPAQNTSLQLVESVRVVYR